MEKQKGKNRRGNKYYRRVEGGGILRYFERRKGVYVHVSVREEGCVFPNSQKKKDVKRQKTSTGVLRVAAP